MGLLSTNFSNFFFFAQVITFLTSILSVGSKLLPIAQCDVFVYCVSQFSIEAEPVRYTCT